MFREAGTAPGGRLGGVSGPSRPGFGDQQRVGVPFLLAFSCEAIQRGGDARGYYQRVYATDIPFRDAAARLAALDQVAR